MDLLDITSFHNLGFLNGTNGTPNQFEVRIKAYFGVNNDEGNWGDVCTITANPQGTDDFTIIDPDVSSTYKSQK